MPWPFCPSCRATLRVNTSGDIDCDVCPYRSNLADLARLPSSTTHSMDRPSPIWAKTDAEQRALQQRSNDDPVRATIEETCTRCGAREVGYYTVQLRSVDEGQTVFYECPACKYTWSVNN
jgi:DNA-directed RNA polymerase I subunit RPA12